MSWIPNANPNLVAVLDDGEGLAPIIAWPPTLYEGYGLGRTVTGALVSVIMDRESGFVFGRGIVWPSLTAYRAAANG